MRKKILSIVESAYRGTLEEQDDTIVWLSHALKRAGADIQVLLRGNAVNYAVRGQDASGLSFGGRRQSQPPRLEQDVTRLIESGVAVSLIDDDLTARGIDASDLIDGVERVAAAGLPKLFDSFEQVWHW